MKKIIGSTLGILLFLNLFPAHSQETLTLVYKDIGKPFYMAPAPDNSGLYFDLITAAVEKIGFKLKIIRVPKKRGYSMLNKGVADLYPSTTINKTRADFLFYIPNGLRRIETYYGLTAMSVPELKSVSQINEYGLQWLVELGSTQPKQASDFGVPYNAIKKVEIDKAIKLIQAGRPFFYRVIKRELESYMEENDISDMSAVGIKVHKNCHPNIDVPLYLGFSRYSPHYREQKNINYVDTKPLTIDNYPYELVRGSVPDRLRNALQEMIDNGEVKALQKKYGVN